MVAVVQAEHQIVVIAPVAAVVAVVATTKLTQQPGSSHPLQENLARVADKTVMLVARVKQETQQDFQHYNLVLVVPETKVAVAHAHLAVAHPVVAVAVVLSTKTIPAVVAVAVVPGVPQMPGAEPAVVANIPVAVVQTRTQHQQQA